MEILNHSKFLFSKIKYHWFQSLRGYVDVIERSI